jgi:hypothetical protein
LRGVSLALCVVASVALAQSARIVLRWKEVAGASAYELQIARDPGFVEVVLQTRSTTAGYRWDELPKVTHWWRVRSIDAEGRAGEWSPPRTIAVDSVVPEVLKPVEGGTVACGTGVEVELAASKLVKEYLLEVSQSSVFQSARELKQTTPGFSLGVLGPGPWYVRARAVDLKGTRSAAGPVRTFSVRVPPPRLKTIADQVLGAGQVQLAWAEAACATSYLVEAAIEGRDRVSVGAKEPLLAFKSNGAGEYRWRVAGVDEHGTSGEFSAEGVFHVKLPPPAPRPEVVGATRAELAWAPVPTAASYKVELLGDQKPVRVVAQATVTTPTWKSGDLPSGFYSWRVQARDARGHVSAFSELRRFERRVLQPLPVPAFAATPEVFASHAEVELSWSASAGATQYELEVDGAPLPAVPVTHLTLNSLADGAHTVRVRALALPAGESPPSALLAFFVGVPASVELSVRVVGDEVQVTLLDAKGRAVTGAAPTLAMKQSALSGVTLRDEKWVARWSALSDDDVLTVVDRTFRAERALHRPLPAPFWVAAGVGGVFNGGAVGSPSGALAVGWRLAPWRRRLGVELRGGVAHASSTLPLQGFSVVGSAWLVPLSLLANWQQPLGSFVVRGAVGPSLQLAFVTVGAESTTRALPGLEAAASLSRPLGPGRLELELGFTYARFDATLARLNAGGVALRVGYVLDFEPGATGRAGESY